MVSRFVYFFDILKVMVQRTLSWQMQPNRELPLRRDAMHETSRVRSCRLFLKKSNDDAALQPVSLTMMIY
jgi:hypothetical protein